MSPRCTRPRSHARGAGEETVIATFRIAHLSGNGDAPAIEEVEADVCLYVGDWLELLDRGNGRKTVVRILHRTKVASVIEVAEPVGVVHLLQDDLSPERAAGLVEEVRRLLDAPGITNVDVRASSRALASLEAAGFVALVDQATGRCGKRMTVTRR